MSILKILETYGASTFEFISNSLSYDCDYIELQIKLNTLIKNKKIKEAYVSENGRTVYELIR